MFRTVVLRVARSVPTGSIQMVALHRPLNATPVRHNSTQPHQPPEAFAKKAAIKEREALQKDWDAKILSYEELLPKTERPTEDTFLIDVREADEVAQGMIPSALNIPLSILPESLHLSPGAFRERFGFEKPRPQQEVIFYCRSGKRSTTASDVAKRNGYTNILNYAGSWLEWTDKQSPKPSA